MKWLMHYGTPRHSGRYPWGSGKKPYQNTPYSPVINFDKKQDYITFPKNSNFYRFSQNKEKKIRDNTYVFMDPKDRNKYFEWAISGMLGGEKQDPDKIYEIKIKNLNPSKILTGAKITRVIINTVGDKKALKVYNKLEKKGFYDIKTVEEKQKFYEKMNRKMNMELRIMHRWMHNNIYGNKEMLRILNNFCKKYGLDGYVDPEDYHSTTRISPIVLTNKDNLKIVKTYKYKEQWDKKGMNSRWKLVNKKILK